MPVVAMTREMGTLGRDVAAGLSEELGVPVLYQEVIEPLADRMRVRKSHVVRLLEGRTGVFERLNGETLSMFVHSADEIIASALREHGAIIRGWGATHLLRRIPHVACVRVCTPFELRKRRMMERLNTEDPDAVSSEIRHNDEAHTAIMRRIFGLQWTDAEHYDMVLNTERVSIPQCVDAVLTLLKAPQFQETAASRQMLEDHVLAAKVRAVLMRSPETRDRKVRVKAELGRIKLYGARCSTNEMLILVETVYGVEGVRDVSYRTREDESPAAPKPS